ncbi:MAG: cell division protein FtsK [Dehalococcoidia bacterium]
MMAPDPQAARRSAHHRPPRVREIIQSVEIDIPSAPVAPRPAQIAPLGRVLLITLLPSLMPPVALGLATWALGLSSTVIITSMALAGSLGLAVVVTTLMSRRDEQARVRAERNEYEAKLAEYMAALRDIDARCRELVARESGILERQFPKQDQLSELVTRDRDLLWERRPGDDDFLHVRLGTWTRPSCIRFKRTGSTDEHAKAKELVERHRAIPGAPLTIELTEGTAKGLFGERYAVDTTLGAIVHQLAVRHAPSEVRLAVLSRDEELCDSAKWLPHARLESRRETTHLVGRTGAEAVHVLRAIAADVRTQGVSGPAATSYVVIADGRDWDSLPGRLARWLGPVRDRVRLVVAKDSFAELPGDCDEVIDLATVNGRLRRKAEPQTPPEFTLDEFDSRTLKASAVAITSLAEHGDVVRSPIPRTARLADILGLSSLTPGEIAASWSRSREAFRLAAPIGIGPNDEVVSIDLRRDGPHGLIAGTTGSGKSELLQSLVASLAVKIPPDLLNFVLIDYKGGSAFREVADLPQVVGVVTDLDERLANRALESLRAEMRRREHLLATTSPAAANIIEYQARRRDVPLANLVIIIDEFHRLVTEQPDFVEQMVRIAQQGRSLGVHLLLSTQKPSGVVTDQIRANTNLRIALRVTDDADSRDVLGTAEAALIPRDLPGRVYIRAGTDPLRVCQAGRISGEVRRAGPTAPVTATMFLEPVRSPIVRRNGIAARLLPPIEAEADDEEDNEDLVDERTLLVQAVREASRLARLPAQQSPWRLPLPTLVRIEDLPAEGADTMSAVEAVVGILDEPELQSQRPFALSLAAGHVCIAGSANTGKTSALIAIAQAFAGRTGPDGLHIYGLDFAGGDLEPLQALPHCGGIAAQHEWPRVQWVIQALRDIVAERLAGRTPEPRANLLVLVDNFTGFWSALQDAESGQEYVDDLVHLMDIGRAVGVTFVVSLERPDTMRANLLAMMSTRLALPMTDAEGYSAFGLSRVAKAGEPIRGRAWLAGRTPHEVQLGLPTELDAERTSRLAATDGGPLQIAPLPDSVTYASILGALGDRAPDGVVLGLREGTRPLFVLPSDQSLIVVGPRRSGRSNALAVAAREALRLGATRLFIANPRRSEALRALKGSVGGGGRYAESPDDCAELLRHVAETAQSLLEAFARGEPLTERWALVVDDADVLDVPMDAAGVTESLVLRGVDVGAALYLSANSQALRAFYPAGLIRALLNQRAGILLAPSTSEDFDLLGARGKPQLVPVGRGWWCEGGGKTAVQVALG